MNEDGCRMFPAVGRMNQRPGQPDVSAREADIFMSLDVDAPRDTWRRTLALPRQRGDLAAGVALKLDPGLDRGRDRRARTGKEAVVIRRIQRSKLAGFVERAELVRFGEFVPYLQIHEGIRFPLIHAGVFAKNPFFHGPHGRV
jgi:hypothetical protein